MNTSFNNYPHCEICDAGGIASNDCPNCKFKLIIWYEKEIKRLKIQCQRRQDVIVKLIESIKLK